MQALRFELAFKKLENQLIEYRDFHHKGALKHTRAHFVKLLTAIENMRLGTDVPLVDQPPRSGQ